MKSILGALACAFLTVSLAQARPVILQETVRIEPPEAGWGLHFGEFGVAIDGDFALISNERFVTDAQAEGGVRRDGVAYLYQRNGSQWNHVGQLGAVRSIPDTEQPGLAMKNGIAVVVAGGTFIYERLGNAWVPATAAPNATLGARGGDIKIDGDRILFSRVSYNYDSVVLRRMNGVWTREGELYGHRNDGLYAPSALQDLQGDRAAIFNDEGVNIESPRARLYTATNGVWSETAVIADTSTPYFGKDVALSGPYIAIGNKRERGTNVYYWPQGDRPTLTKYAMHTEDAYMLYPYSAWNVERLGPYFGVRTTHYDINGSWAIDLFRINDDAAHSNTHVATLWTSRRGGTGGAIGDHIDFSNNRVITNGANGFEGYNFVRIYDLPAELAAPPVLQYDFETPASLADWQQSPGGLWSTVKVGYSNVYRQRTTIGSNWSLLPATHRRDESIQADVTFRSMADNSAAWVGLVTRHKDDSNYYYVAILPTGYLELRRVLNGKTVVRQRSSALPDLKVGGKYRLRLESTGDEHRAFLDGRLVLFAEDTTIGAGPVGLITNRATADFDNVVVSPNWLTTIVYRPKIWHVRGGTWGLNGSGATTQTFNGGYARAFTGARTDDQVISVRVKPTSFAADNRWVGVLARWQDERNHLYVSLEKRGVVSLWRRTNGVIQQLATQRYPITEGTWYKVRVEIVNGSTRVFVDDQELLRTSADVGPDAGDGTPPKGNVGLITYYATAEYDELLAYQP